MAKKIDNRLLGLEQKFIPEIKVLPVILAKNESQEAGILRVLKEHGLDKVPEGCTVHIMNFYSRSQNHPDTGNV